MAKKGLSKWLFGRSAENGGGDGCEPYVEVEIGRGSVADGKFRGNRAIVFAIDENDLVGNALIGCFDLKTLAASVFGVLECVGGSGSMGRAAVSMAVMAYVDGRSL